ncbi:MAG: hypothetical protein ABGZ24_11955, partial [Fuerstiella sp.]
MMAQFVLLQTQNDKVFHMVATHQHVSILPAMEDDVLRRQDQAPESVTHSLWPLRQHDHAGGEGRQFDGLRVLKHLPECVVSLAVHAALLLACSAIYLTIDFELP